MKKLFYGMVAIALLFPSCESDQNPGLEQETQIDMSDFRVYTDINGDEVSKSNDKSKLGEQRICYTMPNLNRLLSENPGLEKRMYDIEYQTRQFIAAKKPTGTPGPGGGSTNPTVYNGPETVTDYYTQSIKIPVVVNIIEQFDHQVSDDQISTQIIRLNLDFHDSGSSPYFDNVFADCNITFELATDVVNVNRVISGKGSWGTNDFMKFSSKGGIDATDTKNYLNIWVCKIGRGILGYAQFPGGPEATDGIVIDLDYFGETSSSSYGMGRTATHEIGHWLNLRHIWGDGGCSYDDFVADTPISNGPNYGCPNWPTANCDSNDMYMNYMDYTNDQCMYMFTDDQNLRMRALFISKGAREFANIN